MKKLTLLLGLISALTFAQSQLPIAPGCEQYNDKKDQINCFNRYTTQLLETYFHLSSNLYQYFRWPSMNEKITFQLGTEGDFRFKPQEQNSAIMNHVASDVFNFFNRAQEFSNRRVVPAKTKEGKPAVLNFMLPINVLQKEDHVKSDVNKNPILFSIPHKNYMVRLGSDYSFNIYHKNELISTVYSIKDFYDHEILKPLTENSKNLIVEKEINGLRIKLEVENLFKKYQGDLKISYFENDNLIKEYLTMKDFLNSSHSNYIY